jgi:hypothetical protein
MIRIGKIRLGGFQAMRAAAKIARADRPLPMGRLAGWLSEGLTWRLTGCLAIASIAALAAPGAGAQGSRKDDIVFGPEGHPIAGATITVCQPTATGTPCSPLAAVFTDATLSVPSQNPLQADGLGNYHFYAPAGRYLVQITAPQINGTRVFPDVSLPADPSST